MVRSPLIFLCFETCTQVPWTNEIIYIALALLCVPVVALDFAGVCGACVCEFLCGISASRQGVEQLFPSTGLDDQMSYLK